MGVIDNIIQDKADVKNQIGSAPSYYPTLKNFTNVSKIRRLFTKQFFIDPGTSFILGSPTLGVIGTSKLGDRRVEVENFVFPFNGVVEENLVDNTFIDVDNTTAIIDNSTETVTFTIGQVLLSKVVSKIGEPVNVVVLKQLDYTGDLLTFEISTDGGTSWDVISLNESFYYTNGTTNDSVLYRITGTGNSVLSSPIKIYINQE